MKLRIVACLALVVLVWISPLSVRAVQASPEPPEPPADFLLPDLQTLPPYDLRLLVGAELKAIRFSNAIWNSGRGGMELMGSGLSEVSVSISQKIYRQDGTWSLRPAGVTLFSDEHGHWHWDGFSLYEVWSVREDGSLNRLLATSEKVGYCLRDDGLVEVEPGDSVRPAPAAIPVRPVFRGCGWQRQGISVGWQDIYDHETEGQRIMITGVPDGIYALKSTVDPFDRLLESDETNNSAVLYFSIRENRLEVLGEKPPAPSGQGAVRQRR